MHRSRFFVFYPWPQSQASASEATTMLVREPNRWRFTSCFTSWAAAVVMALPISTLMVTPHAMAIDAIEQPASSTASTNGSDLANRYQALSDLYDKAHYQHITQQVSADIATQEAEALLWRAKALYAQGEDAEAFDEWLTEVLAKHPNHAQLNFYGALVKFRLAQAATFSALGLAKDGLALLKKAESLAPTDMTIKDALVGFYLGAPSIAGGDEDEAKRIADVMAQQDVVMGTIAQIKVLLNQEKTAQAQQLLQAALAAQPQHSSLLLQQARMLQQTQTKDDAAQQRITAQLFQLYQQVGSSASKPSEKYSALYDVGRLAATQYDTFTALAAQSQTAATAAPATPAPAEVLQQGKAALTDYIAFYQGGENSRLRWAKLRLAQIHVRLKDTATAQQLLTALQAEKINDKKLQQELKTVAATLAAG